MRLFIVFVCVGLSLSCGAQRRENAVETPDASRFEERGSDAGQPSPSDGGAIPGVIGSDDGGVDGGQSMEPLRPVDFSQMAKDCVEIADVARVSEDEFFMACRDQGVMHVRANGYSLTPPPRFSTVLAVEAASATDIRMLVCNEVYRFTGTEWVSDGDISEPGRCGFSLGGNGDGWFASIGIFGGNGALVERTASKWTRTGWEGPAYWTHYAIFGKDDLFAASQGLDRKISHYRREGAKLKLVSSYEKSATALWRSETGNVLLMANEPGIGVDFKTDGIHRLKGEKWVWEWEPPPSKERGYPRIYGFGARSDTELYAVGGAGVLARSSGDGTWTEIPSGTTTAELRFVWSFRKKLLVASRSEIFVVP
jgi:hypothetical protein